FCSRTTENAVNTIKSRYGNVCGNAIALAFGGLLFARRTRGDILGRRRMFATLSPLTASGIAGVSAEDAGAASGLVNVAHQLGKLESIS
ncbi:MAG: hypothetical protein ACXWCP_25830, partial [Burkholderiales bacterium]